MVPQSGRHHDQEFGKESFSPEKISYMTLSNKSHAVRSWQSKTESTAIEAQPLQVNGHKFNLSQLIQYQEKKATTFLALHILYTLLLKNELNDRAGKK